MRTLVVMPLALCLISLSHAVFASDFPEVSLGTNPHRSFGSTAAAGSTDPVLDVPEGQEFIVTMFRTQNEHFEVLQDSLVLLSGVTITRHSSVGVINGSGRMRVAEGSTLFVRGLSGGGGDYYLQGYFIRAGSPYRSFNGVTVEYGRETVFTADADRDFIVRTASVASSSCDLYLDDVLHLEGDAWSMLDQGTDAKIGAPGFVRGLGALVVPAGSQVQLNAHGVPCDYYFEGEYVER